MFLLALLVAARAGRLRSRRRSALVIGLAILSNTRLAAAAARARRVPPLAARRAGWPRCSCPSSPALAIMPWVVRNKVAGRLLRDHDRRARALEGEQPEHLRHARATAAGSTTCRSCRATPTTPTSGARTIVTSRPRPRGRRRRVRAAGALPAPGARVLARPPGREGQADGAGDVAAVGPVGAETERRRPASGALGTLRPSPSRSTSSRSTCSRSSGCSSSRRRSARWR